MVYGPFKHGKSIMSIQTTLGDILLYNSVYVIWGMIEGVEKVIYVGKAEDQSVGGDKFRS